MTTAIVTVVMFLVLISIHEFGHFAASKLCGVKVLEFAIGMGPTLLKKQTTETLYTLRALPIGGFCRLEGEEGDSKDTKAFCNQKPWKKFIIVVAGAILNIVLGYILCVVILSFATSYTTTVIDSIDTDSYLDDAGVLAGDKIVEINGHKIGFYPEIDLYSSEFKEGESASIAVKRDGQIQRFDVPLSKYSVKQTYTEEGISSVTTTNGVEKQTLIPYGEKISKDDAEIGKIVSVDKIILGFSPKLNKVTFMSALDEAFHYTVYLVKLVYRALFDLVTGQIGLNQMSGPVGIVNEVNNMVHSGKYWIENTLYLIALLTVNLGVFNLLPLPALDGGRLLFIIVEMIRRKPIPPEKEAIVHVIGFVLLMLLAVCVTFFDIMRIVQK